MKRSEYVLRGGEKIVKGTKVKIADLKHLYDLDIDIPFSINYEMCKYSNKILTVSRVIQDTYTGKPCLRLHMKEDNGNWSWSLPMLVRENWNLPFLKLDDVLPEEINVKESDPTSCL